MDESRIPDIIEIQQLAARYAVGMTRHDIPSVQAVFTLDGTYSAFGEIYTIDDFPILAEAAPRGMYNCGTPAITFESDTEASGMVTLCFIQQDNHDMRLGWYTDTYRRTDEGWRLATRKMTFLRRNGSQDSGRAHDPLRPPGSLTH